MILDYSQHVEVVAREADATAYPYYPSDLDIKRSAPRLLSQVHALSRSVPLSFAGLLTSAINDQEVESLFEERLQLFDAIETFKSNFTSEEKSKHRTLSEWLGSVCYICGALTSIVRDESSDSRVPHIKVRACSKCGWWESENTAFVKSTNSLSYDSFTLLRRACLREFAVLDDATPIEALRNHVIRHPRELNLISPRKLELLVCSVFSDYFSCEAVHVGGPGDGGYDLILLVGDNPALVQVKQRVDPNRAEPVASIREFLGAIMLAGAKTGFFVTSAGRFSGASQEAAERASKTIVDKLELVDASKLIDILKMAAVNAEPWRLHAHSLTDELPDFTAAYQEKFVSFQNMR